jgi:hypothetical protein
LKEPFESGLELKENGLDVLARAQPIDPKINAVARELPLPQVADFDRICQTAAGLNTKVGEDRMSRVGVRYAKILCLRPRAAAIDFILIGCPPIMWRRHFNARLQLLCHAGIIHTRA